MPSVASTSARLEARISNDLHSMLKRAAELPLLFSTPRAVRYQEPMEIVDFGLQRVRVVQFCAEKAVE